MNIKVLGSGCANCKTLEHRTQEALEQLGMTADVEKVEDHQRIASYGIMRTPGLVIDEKVALTGTVPTVEKIKELLLVHRSS